MRTASLARVRCRCRPSARAPAPRGIIRRLMRGERQEPRLFADIILFIEFIRVHETRQSLTRAAEIAIAMRTLAELGYGGEGEIWRTFGENSFSEFLVGEAAERKSDCVRLINARLAETHL